LKLIYKQKEKKKKDKGKHNIHISSSYRVPNNWTTSEGDRTASGIRSTSRYTQGILTQDKKFAQTTISG